MKITTIVVGAFLFFLLLSAAMVTSAFISFAAKRKKVNNGPYSNLKVDANGELIGEIHNYDSQVY